MSIIEDSELQQAVDGLGLLTSSLTHALGGTTSGSCQQYALAKSLKRGDDTQRRGGLASAWTARQHHHLRADGLADSRELHVVVFYLSLSAHIVADGSATVEDVAHRRFYQPTQLVGHAHLCIIERRQEDGFVVEHQVLTGYHLVKGLRNRFLLGLKKLLGRLHQLFALSIANFSAMESAVLKPMPQMSSARQ